MKKIIFTVIILALLPSCARKGTDVMATYKGGEVTRKEVHDHIYKRRIIEDKYYENKTQQRRTIQYIAILENIFLQARESIPDTDEKFKKIKWVNYTRLLSQRYYHELEGKEDYTAEILRYSLIKMFVKNYRMEGEKRVRVTDAEKKKMLKEKIEEARVIIDRVKKGDDFAELVQIYSTDYSKRKGGDQGYICKGMPGNEDINDILFGLNKGEVSNEPFVKNDTVSVFYITDRRDVNRATISEYVVERNNKREIESLIVPPLLVDKVLKRVKCETCLYKPEAVLSGAPGTIVYKNGDLEVKVSDVVDFVGYLRMYVKSDFKKPFNEMNREEKLVAAKFVILNIENARVAKEEKFDLDPAMNENWKENLDTMSLKYYTDNYFFNDIAVEESEIKAEYDLRKKRPNARIGSYSAEKEKIKDELLNKKKNLKYKDLYEKVLEGKDFKINESMLEGREAEDIRADFEKAREEKRKKRIQEASEKVKSADTADKPEEQPK